MKNHHVAKRLALLGMAALLMISPALNGQQKEKKLKIEIYGGLALINPQDINGRIQYHRDYYDLYTEGLFSYYRSLYGEFYSYTGGKEGEFNKIKHAVTFGGRIKYRIGPSLWISLGYKNIRQTENSDVYYNYITHSVNPDAVVMETIDNVEYQFSPYTLKIEAHVPQIGLHYTFKPDRPIHWEAYIAAGPMIASCDWSYTMRYRTTDQYGYWNQNDTRYQMDGDGTGISLETGLRVDVKLMKHIDLFLEGTYAYQRVRSPSGDGMQETFISDSNSEGYTAYSNEWSGSWRQVVGTVNRNWGRFEFSYPSNFPGSSGRSANLDLSGFQAKVGLSFSL